MIMSQSAVSFQRRFSIVTDITVNEYIRRRRMTLAAYEMQNSKAKVIDIALKFGYESRKHLHVLIKIFMEYHQ